MRARRAHLVRPSSPVGGLVARMRMCAVPAIRMVMPQPNPWAFCCQDMPPLVIDRYRSPCTASKCCGPLEPSSSPVTAPRPPPRHHPRQRTRRSIAVLIKGSIAELIKGSIAELIKGSASCDSASAAPPCTAGSESGGGASGSTDDAGCGSGARGGSCSGARGGDGGGGGHGPPFWNASSSSFTAGRGVFRLGTSSGGTKEGAKGARRFLLMAMSLRPS